jgi:hypothetical protein
MMKKCSKCGEVKDLASFHKLNSSKDGHRPDCKDCCKKQRDERNNKDIVRYKAYILGSGIMSRIKYDVDNPKNNCYKEHNVKCTIGNTPKEISDYLYENYYDEIKSLIDEGKTPSVDRIDSNDNYSQDNIRIIELKENVKLGVENAIKKTSKRIKSIKDNEIIIYDSISQASKELGIKRDTIYAHLDNDTLTRYGYKFESVV